jgi:hypothetical protein
MSTKNQVPVSPCGALAIRPDQISFRAQMTPTKARRITPEEAREIALRFINGHFGNAGDKPRVSIPARPDYDDDIRLLAFIDQYAAPKPVEEGAQKVYGWDESVGTPPTHFDFPGKATPPAEDWAEQMIAWIGDPNATEDRLDEIEKFWGEGTPFREAVAQAMLHNGAPLRSAPQPPAPVNEVKVREVIADAIDDCSNTIGEITSPPDELAAHILTALRPFLSAPSAEDTERLSGLLKELREIRAAHSEVGERIAAAIGEAMDR